jgi:hypothetical protein
MYIHKYILISFYIYKPIKKLKGWIFFTQYGISLRAFLALAN